jgi:hypothetical protein
MREAGCACEGALCPMTQGEAKVCDAEIERIGKALHDLCQPLTTLQCRLELAGLIGTAEAYREAVRLGLVECERLVEAVGAMREIVRAARS